MKPSLGNEQTLEFEEELDITVSPPQLCHFCNKPITKMNGHDFDSLLTHHTTYIPEVRKMRSDAIMGDDNPMRQPGVPEKVWKIRRKRYPSGFKDPDHMKGDKNPMKNPVHLAAMVTAKRKARIERKQLESEQKGEKGL